MRRATGSECGARERSCVRAIYNVCRGAARGHHCHAIPVVSESRHEVYNTAALWGEIYAILEIAHEITFDKLLLCHAEPAISGALLLQSCPLVTSVSAAAISELES